MELTTLQLFTFAIAVLGATLGIINTWHNLDKSRVKLKVLPTQAIHSRGPYENLYLCIEITNLSSFAVTVCETGVFYKSSNNRSVIPNPVLPDGGNWPRRLEPRSSVSVLSQKPRTSKERKINCAFAKTQCGVVLTGKSEALNQMANEYEA